MLDKSQRPASDYFELVIETAGRWRRIMGWFAVLASGVMSLGDFGSVTNPGARLFVVRDRQTHRQVLRHQEPIGDDGAVTLATLRADLASMTVERFVAEWCPSEVRDTSA